MQVDQSVAKEWSRAGEVIKKWPRFDIAPKEGYPKDASESSSRCRRSEVSDFAWHPETDESNADHWRAEQWEFDVLATEPPPSRQRSIGLSKLRDREDPVRFDALASAVDALASAPTR